MPANGRFRHTPTMILLAAAAWCQAAAAAPPDWFLEEIRLLTSGSGRWIADNSAYRSDEEPYDAYVTEWRASFDGTTMTGRLYGLRDGEPSVDFWEFRQYWHPGRNEAVLEQFGWGGTVGIGTARRDGDETRTDQTFHTADGGTNRVGHVGRFPDDVTHVTDSFDVDAEGTWVPRRSYTWKRE